MAAKRRAVRLREATKDGGAMCMEAFHSSASISVRGGGAGESKGSHFVCLMARIRSDTREGQAPSQDCKTARASGSTDTVEGVDRDHAYVCGARRQAKVTLGKSISSGLVIGHLSHPSGRELGLSQKTYPAFSNVQRLDNLSQREKQIMDQEEGIKCPVLGLWAGRYSRAGT